jgi:biopolymer transport protein ExbB/TolQ
MMLHAGSAMIAMGIAIAILGTPDRLLGLLAAAIGVIIFKRLAAVSRDLVGKRP